MDFKAHDNPLKILLVEDNAVDVQIITKAFKSASVEVEMFVAVDGQDAYDYLLGQGQYQDRDKFFLPQIVLLNIRLPKLDGFEVLKKIRNTIALRNIPVVMLSNSSSPADINKSYECGASSFILKPGEANDFERFMKEFLLYWTLFNELPKSEPKERKEIPQQENVKRSQKKILLVDDVDSDCYIIKKQLSDAGFKDVTTAPSGERALEIFGQGAYDVAIVDTNLGYGINGFEICTEMKRINGQAKVVLITGQVDTFDAGAAQNAGADEYLAKTADQRRLLELISEYSRA